SAHSYQRLLLNSEPKSRSNSFPAANGQSAVRHAIISLRRSRGTDCSSLVKNETKSLILMRPSSNPSRTSVSVSLPLIQDFHRVDSNTLRVNAELSGMSRNLTQIIDALHLAA